MAIASLGALPLHGSAQEISSAWKRTGENTGRNVNLGRAFSDSRLVKPNEVTMSFDASRFDPSRAIRFEVRPAVANVTFEAFDAKGDPVSFRRHDGSAHVELRAGEVEVRPVDGFSALIAGRTQETALTRVSVKFDPAHPVNEVEMYYIPAGLDHKVNMSPDIAQPRHAALKRAPEIQISEGKLAVRNATLEASFSTTDHFRLLSLRNEYAGKDLLLDPDLSGIFLIDSGTGRVASAKDWVVKAVILAPDHQSAKVTLTGREMEGVVTLTINEETLRLGLEITNTGKEPRTWKTVFPQLGGLAISDTPDKDYYLFPYYGGLVQNVNTQLRLFYGGNEAMWQMVDLFSPEAGTGLSVRLLDETGRLKGVAFRKGKSNPAYTTHLSNLYKRLPEGSYWKNSLPAGEGSSLGFEYSSYTRAPGKSYVYPDAVIQMHPGGWQEAMASYATWARATWKGRPLHSKLDDIWNIQTIMASTPTEKKHQKPLYNFRDKTWYAGYQEDEIDMGEFRHWWKWSEKGPFGVDLSKGKEDILRQMHNRWSYFFFKHPYKEQMLLAVNDGDYDYNPLMGGLEGLKTGIKTAHDHGALVQFYTDPFIVDSTTQMGQQYGRRFSVVNPTVPHTPGLLPESPDGGHVVTYAKWSMCVDNDEYQEIFAKNMARIVRDTGVDSIRMDQFGYTGMTCFSKEHTHKHAEEGEHAVLQSMKTLLDKVREHCDAENPQILLTAEYPGADITARQLDGALTYEVSFWSRAGLRPLPLNIFRFYFPEVKLYDNPAGHKATNLQEIALWNGIGLFQVPWKSEYRRILKQNEDAFRSDTVSPLIPTKAEFVYANRFTKGDKEIDVLYNDRGEASTGAVLAAEESAQYHYFDLLGGGELPVKNGAVSLAIAPEKVGVVARLPRSLKVEPNDNGWVISLGKEATHLLVCNAEGATLHEELIPKGEDKVTLPREKAGQYIKLLRGNDLIDAAPLTEAHQ